MRVRAGKREDWKELLPEKSATRTSLYLDSMSSTIEMKQGKNDFQSTFVKT